MKVAVFNKNYSNETEEVTKFLSDVFTSRNIKIIVWGQCMGHMCYLKIPPQILYHKYYDNLKVRPSLPNLPSNNIPSTVARNKPCAPVKWWEHHQDATILIKTMKKFLTLHIHITNPTSLSI